MSIAIGSKLPFFLGDSSEIRVHEHSPPELYGEPLDAGTIRVSVHYPNTLLGYE